MTSRSKIRDLSIEQKKKMIERANEVGLKQTADEFNVATSTVSKWRKRYREGGIEALVCHSTRPHHQPKKTSQWIIDKIIGIKKQSPEMGSVAMSQYLKRNEEISLSSNTVAKIFKKQELPDGDKGHAESSYRVKGDKDAKLEKEVRGRNLNIGRG